MSSRPKISEDLASRVLIRCKRRCCLCVYLDYDNNVKRGQIAHINHKPDDNREDNLVFLCLTHHDQYDGQTRLSRKFAADELKYYRDLLCEEYAVQPECSDVPTSIPIEVLEDAIACYYDDDSQYTSSKIYMTPSLDQALFIADKHEVIRYCRDTQAVHLIHSTKGLGILPHKPMRSFFQMEQNLVQYEARKQLRRDRSDLNQIETVREWIDLKTNEAYNLVCHYLNYNATQNEKDIFDLPKHIARLSHARQDIAPFFHVDRGLTKALIRFTFHVGKLYRCAIKNILVLCSNHEECEWFRVLNNAVSTVGAICDVLPEMPHYDYLVLPPLKVAVCAASSERIIAAASSNILPEENTI